MLADTAPRGRLLQGLIEDEGLRKLGVGWGGMASRQ